MMFLYIWFGCGFAAYILTLIFQKISNKEVTLKFLFEALPLIICGIYGLIMVLMELLDKLLDWYDKNKHNKIF